MLCYVDDAEVKAKISGVVRGLIHDGLMVNEGEKLGDVDPRGNIKYCYTISDKGRTIKPEEFQKQLCIFKQYVV